MIDGDLSEHPIDGVCLETATRLFIAYIGIEMCLVFHWHLLTPQDYSQNQLVLLWNTKTDSQTSLSSRSTADSETVRLCAPKNPIGPAREIRPAPGQTFCKTGNSTAVAPPSSSSSTSSSSSDQVKCLILNALQARSQSSGEEIRAIGFTDPRASCKSLQGHWLGGNGDNPTATAPLSAPHSQRAYSTGAKSDFVNPPPSSSATSMMIVNPPLSLQSPPATQRIMPTPNNFSSLASTRKLSLAASWKHMARAVRVMATALGS
ncbi:unnamed protein product [Dibothriocephalus latus]|uniref:Uncharacterized protein n=1 Tax=Dibothriocephalus latus TaxID=60516 RepID=A0A3P7NLC4_DIBLA|nr:unnamed protein product [Dibothriocephalus latus]